MAEFDISIHALLAESYLSHFSTLRGLLAFLSTLSLRRATTSRLHKILADWDFYPRSPCGERQPLTLRPPAKTMISIHALLAESDTAICLAPPTPKNFYPRSPCGERLDY